MKILPLILIALFLPGGSAAEPIPEAAIPRFGGCYFARVGLTPLWRMRDQDGIIREFEPHAKNKALLIGCGGWTAKTGANGEVTVETPRNIDPHLVYHFKEGRLAEAEINGKHCRFGYPEPLVYENSKIVPLWPDVSANAVKEFEDRMTEKWNFGRRWKFGFASPNQAGVVLATVLLMGLAMALKCTRIAGRVGFAVLSLIALILVMLTASRGAMIAIAAGALPLLAYQVRHRSKVLLGMALGLALFAALGLGASHSMASNRRGGDSLRVELLRAAPRMFCDAPGGWGSRGDVGKAYTNWYQTKTSSRRMFGLVSDHLTEVVALGWVKGGLYVFAWVAGLLVLWFVVWRGGTAVPAVAWTALGVAAAFNVVIHTRYVSWIALATLPLLIQERCLRSWRFWIWPCALGLLIAVGVTGGMIGVGKSVRIDAPQVSRVDQGVIVNGKTASIWHVADPEVLGLITVEKEIRNLYEQAPQAPAIGYTEDLDAVPLQATQRLVLSGRRGEEFLARFREGKITQLPPQIVFLAPPFGYSKIPLKLRAQARVQVVIGEFAARYYEDYAHPQKWVTLVKGAEVYIPGWMRFCVGNF